MSAKEILKKKKKKKNSLDLCNDCKPIVEASFLELADIKNELENLSTDLNEREPIDLSDVTNTLEDIKSHLESIEANTDKS